jgi:hypothetical protein
MTHNQQTPTEPLTSPADAGASRRHRRIVITAAAVVALLAVMLFVALRAAGGGDTDAPVNGMTPQLAVSFVQDEFPGQFTDGEKLIKLFTATCVVLDAGGDRQAATLPMIQGGLTAEQASYILDMSVYSTCPKYAPPTVR